MISVQNRLRLLNGNKSTVLVFMMCLLGLIACNPSKKTVTKTRTTRPTTTARTNTKPKLETIEWTDVTPKEKIEEPKNVVEGAQKETYNIAILLPFNSHKATDDQIIEEGFDENRFTNYYAGIKLALENLEQRGIRFNVKVMDTKVGNFTTKIDSLGNTDLIIGPYNKDKLKFVASWCKDNQVTLISPWQSSSKITSENPYYIQLRPNIKTYMRAIIDDVRLRYDNDQVVFIKREAESKDQAMIDYMQRYASTLFNSEDKIYSEYEVNQDSLTFGKTAFDSVFIAEKPPVFILPNYSFSKDESYIYSCVRKLSSEIGFEEVYLYGMPILLDSDKIEFDHYKSLNMRVCRSKYVDREDPRVKRFRNYFFKRYHALPQNDAIEGYDMMLFVGEKLAQFGTDFYLKLDDNRQQMLQTAFDIQVVHSGEDDFKTIEYFENQSLDIIGFDDNRFKRIR